MNNAITVGETQINGSIHIHRYNSSIQITDITNSGKRGKKCSYVSVFTYHDSDMLDPLADMLVGVEDWAGVEEKVGHIKIDREINHNTTFSVEAFEKRGVDVVNEVSIPIIVENDLVKITAKLGGFTIACKKDMNNEPRMIPSSSTGKRGAKKFYNHVSKMKIESDTGFSDVIQIFNALDVDYHYYCAMD
jgi:hypothetical protein